LSIYLNLRLWYNYFPFWKTNVRHIGILLPVSILTISPKIRPPTAETWRHINFLKMVAMAAQYYFRFPMCWCHCIQRVKIYQATKFCGHISIHGCDITTSRFKKQTSAILEFYFRFRYRPFRRNLHIILYLAAKFRPNWSTHCGNMTLYQFFKMAAVQY